jgi:hypothetical protein
MSKSIAIIETPITCEKCIFHVCRYSLPLSTYRKGYYCQLDNDREVFDLDFDDHNFKSKKCPLEEVK